MKYTIGVDVSEIVAGVSEIAAYLVQPSVHAAIGAAAEAVEGAWKTAVLKAGGKGGLSAFERDEYAKSISWFYETDFTAVVRSTYAQAIQIEEGRPARDLKAMLGTSAKVRLSGAGKKYLIIPFRHNTPGNTALASDMPTDVYAMAKQMSPSRATGQTMRPSGLLPGVMVPGKTYQWGDRLPPGLAPKLSPSHASDPHAGMVKMDASTDRAKSSAYLTFRVMSEDSTGWIIPARPGLFIVKSIVESAPQFIQSAVRGAMSGVSE